MANNNQQQKTQTTTQIRNMYSEGMSYLNIKFFNVNLSFQFSPFMGSDQNGRSQYDFKNSLTTTVNFEGAFVLYKAANDIISGNVNECDLVIPCPNNTSLSLKRSMGPDGQMQTVFAINKNNMVIPFKFSTTDIHVVENGQQITKRIESGLGAFMKTVEGYLTGINADRHLDKLTEEFVAIQNQQNGQNQQGGQQRQWNNNSQRKPFNNRRQYNNQYPNQQTGWQQNQQNMSTYSLPN